MSGHINPWAADPSDVMTIDRGDESRLVLGGCLGRVRSSWRRQTWLDAIIASELKATTRLVLLALASKLPGTARPVVATIDTVAGWAGLSERSVQTHARLARETGFLRVVQRADEDGCSWAPVWVAGVPKAMAEKFASRLDEAESDEAGNEQDDAPKSEAVVRWAGRLVEAADEAGLRLRDSGRAAIDEAAGRIADTDAPELVFRALVAIMMARGRQRAWPDFVAALPDTSEDLVVMSRTVDAYERKADLISADLIPFRDAPGSRWLADIVPILVEVAPGATEYVRHAEQAWCQHPSAVFSAAVRKELSKKLRGLLGAHAGLQSDIDTSHITGA